MNGDTFSIKAPKDCSKKFAATLKGKCLTRGNVLRILFGSQQILGCLYREGVATDHMCGGSITNTTAGSYGEAL